MKEREREREKIYLPKILTAGYQTRLFGPSCWRPGQVLMGHRVDGGRMKQMRTLRARRRVVCWRHTATANCFRWRRILSTYNTYSGVASTYPSSISDNLFFFSSVETILTAILWGRLSGRRTACDSSGCSSVVRTSVDFVSFLCDKSFSFVPSFVPPSHQILTTPPHTYTTNGTYMVTRRQSTLE